MYYCFQSLRMTVTSHLLSANNCFWICFNSQCPATADKIHNLPSLPQIVYLLSPRFWKTLSRLDQALSCVHSRGGEKERPWEHG